MLSDVPASAGTELVPASVRQPWVEGLLDIRNAGGIVTRLGPAGKVPHTAPVVDLDGRYVIPGLWDEHVHMNAVGPGR